MTDRTTKVLTENADDLLRYFRRRVGSDDAPDLLADTLMTAWRRAPALPQDPGEARAWLFGIAHKTLLNHRRGIQRRTRLADRVRTLVATADVAPAADAGLDVRAAINALDPKHAEIVRLVHWEGFTLAHVADILNQPASTVRNHYQQAKQQLREALQAAATC
ncbi:RNA polymerase sigma factor [Nocardioides glacieisoli]|uniref:RNA polymerase sigma factor n=1 Tax=Nocardioides glacieisoli TaxID=1168730 RepID=UPI0013ED5445|nr:RNA polymerase sigma factor [Nocardioides glacieisoli]